MTRELLIAFAFCFLAGPILFRGLVSIPITRTRAVLMALAIAVLGLFAFSADKGTTFANPVMPPAALTLVSLWLAWVVALALVAQAAQARLADPRLRRSILMSSLVATTLPWFGLAASRALSA
jgi:hypothetical protein